MGESAEKGRLISRAGATCPPMIEPVYASADCAVQTKIWCLSGVSWLRPGLLKLRVFNLGFRSRTLAFRLQSLGLGGLGFREPLKQLLFCSFGVLKNKGP